MAKKAAAKKASAAKTPKKPIAPSGDNSSEAIEAGTQDATEQGEASRDDAGSEAGDRATPPAETQGEWENPGDNRFSSRAVDPPAAAQPPASGPLARARDGETRSQCWERLRREGRAAGMTRRGAIAYASGEVDRLFPPAEPVVEEDPPAEPGPELVEPPPEPAEEPAQPAPIAVAPAPKPDDSGVSGLSDLPPSWPELPANAQLQVEIAWVTANRLRVRDGTGVNLARALSPAPSYSALSWLETSILFPAKFADISVKATATTDDEKEHIRREKLSIEEMRSILKEMLEG